jgi:hypothetical protein
MTPTDNQYPTAPEVSKEKRKDAAALLFIAKDLLRAALEHLDATPQIWALDPEGFELRKDIRAFLKRGK